MTSARRRARAGCWPGAVATGLVALVLTEQALVDAERLSVVFHPLRLALSAGAAAALIVGWVRPAPWLLALLLVAILSGVWYFAVSRFLRADAWGQHDRRTNGRTASSVSGDNSRPSWYAASPERSPLTACALVPGRVRRLLGQPRR
jgi:hypothetical protein